MKYRVEGSSNEITTVSGEKSQAVTFKKPFRRVPIVVACLAEDPGAGKRGLTWVHSITVTGFQFEIDSDVANDTYTFNWIAIEAESADALGT
jgi:hypothetical protein